jgi:TolA-binding protein
MRRILSLLVVFVLLSATIMGCGKKVTEEQLYAQAQKFESEESFKEAIKTYEELVSKYPKGKHADEAQYKIGFLYLNSLQDFQKSIEAYRRVVQDYPDSEYASQAQFMLGYVYANELKKYDKAREAYDLFLRKYPNDQLIASVKWELENLGKDISEIETLGNIPKEKSEAEAKGH